MEKTHCYACISVPGLVFHIVNVEIISGGSESEPAAIPRHTSTELWMVLRLENMVSENGNPLRVCVTHNHTIPDLTN